MVFVQVNQFELDLLHDSVPDEITVLNFRNLLQVKNIFEKINRRLTEKEFRMKFGTIADATLILAPSSTNNESQTRDPEMSSTSKSGKWTLGIRTHIAADFQSGLVHTVNGAITGDHDSTQFEKLLHSGAEIALGDSVYGSKKMRSKLEMNNAFW